MSRQGGIPSVSATEFYHLCGGTCLGSGELARATLVDCIPTLLMRLGGGCRLARYGQAVVLEVDSDVLGLQARQLERCRYDVGVLGFMQV